MSTSTLTVNTATRPPVATISTDVTIPVTVASAAYAKHLLIASTGAVEPDGGTAGIYMVTTGAVVTNDGLVAGNGVDYASGIVITVSGTVFNQGTITGGYHYGNKSGGSRSTGGIGIDVQDGGDVTNAGTITGGGDIATYGQANYKTFGGDGVSQTGGSLFNTGLIGGGAGDRLGGVGISITDGIVDNAGQILGGAASPYLARASFTEGDVTLYTHPLQPLGGGTGAVFSGGTLINSGTIAGAYDSGLGARLTNTNLRNTGKIVGGTGLNAGSLPYSGLDGANGFVGGNGIDIAGTMSVANDGTILGGTGGDAAAGYDDTFSHFYRDGGVGGAGGDGVSISSKMVFTNAGTIAGGAGTVGGNAFGTQSSGDGAAGIGGDGGVGVFLAGGTLINSGMISGGAAGAGGTSPKYGTASSGVAGDAVQLGKASATVVDDPTGVFNGLVVADKSLQDSLVLAGVDPKATLTGIGTQFLNFNVIGFAAGAERTAQGNAAGLADGQTITGFMPHDKLVLTGFSETGVGFASSQIELISAGATIALHLNGSGAHNLLINATSANTTIAATAGAAKVTAGLTELVTGSGSASATTVHADGTLAVYGGGSESVDATILNGGTEAVFSGAIASATDIDGGTLNIAAGAATRGSITFSGTGGELIIGGDNLPAQVISGFTTGDTIQLAGATYAAGASVAVKTAGIVAITDAGKTYDLHIAGATVGEADFVFGPGSLLTKTAAARTMAFLRPAATADHSDIFSEMVTIQHRETSIPAAAGTAAVAGGTPDLLRATPSGVIHAFITLHSG